jgi:hypothetical protein
VIPTGAHPEIPWSFPGNQFEAGASDNLTMQSRSGPMPASCRFSVVTCQLPPAIDHWPLKEADRSAIRVVFADNCKTEKYQ